MKLRLQDGSSNSNKYYCELTEELDRLAGINPHDWWRHYLLIEQFRQVYFVIIGIPGGIVGEVVLEDGVIRSLEVETGYVVGTYPADVNEQIQKFVGQCLEFEKREE